MAEIDPKNIDTVAKSLGVTNKTLERSIKLINEFGKTSNTTYKGLDKNLKKNIKYLSDFTDEIDEGTGKIRKMSKDISKLHLKDALDTNEASKLNSELGKLQDRLIKLKSLKAGAGANEWKAQKIEIKEIQKDIDKIVDGLEGAKLAAMSFGEAMEKSGPSFVQKMIGKQKGVSKEIGGWGAMFDKTGTSMGKMPGLLKLTGGAAKGLGKTLGGVSKMFAGWPGLILMAVKKLWDVGMEADQFVKDSNKAFARLRGPDITSDVKSQFKEFNDQIFKTGDNLRTGMDVSQIRGLLESMVSAGMNITVLNKGLMGYRDAIYVASKASKTLGMELPMVGSAISKMFTDLRMNLDDVDKAFVQVGFDAKKSGLSTDRFWGAVMNATAHLALYGVVMSSASKTMKRFTEDMVGGADDAEEAVGDMYDVFKKGSLENQAAILDMVKHTKGGTKEINEAFKELAGEKGTRALELKGKITLLESQDQTPKVVEELKKSRAELYAAQSQQQEALDSIGKNSVTQAAQMGMLANKTPELLMRAVQGMTGVKDMTQITGDRMWVAIKAAAQMGVSEKTVRMLVRTSQVTEKRLEDLASTSDGLLSKIAGNADIQTGIQKVLNSKDDEQIVAADQLAKLIQKQTGMTLDKAQDYVDVLKAGNANSIEIGKLIGKGDPESRERLKELLTSSETIKNLTSTRFKTQQKTEEEMAAAAEDTFKGIVGQTLSYKEMMEIAKDEIKWRASSLGIFQALNAGVMNIFSFMVRNDKDYMSESQKIAQQTLVATMSGNKELAAKLKVKKGRITASSQADLTKEVVKNLNEVNNKLASQGKVSEALAGALKKDNPVTAIEASIVEATKNKDALIKSGKDENSAVVNTAKETIAALTAQKSELEKTFGLQKKIAEVTARAEVGQMTPADFGSILSAIKTEDPELQQYVRDIVTELTELNGSTSSDGDRKKKADNILIKNSLVAKKKNQSQYEISVKEEELLKSQKGIQEDMLTNLKELSATNAKVEKWEMARIKSDPKAMAEIADDINAQLKLLPDDLSKKERDAKKEALAMDYGFESFAEFEEKVKGMTGRIAEYKREVEITEAGSDPTQTKEFAGLTSPRIVTSPGIVSLHPDEMIMPRNYGDFKSEPVPIIPPEKVINIPGGAGGAAQGKTPIAITINANERDLPERIANVCRRVINDYQMP